MIKQQADYWTNPSVRKFAGNNDPIDFIIQKSQDVILRAMQAGWQGPPFDPFKLAEILEISTIPREDVLDARILTAGSQRLQIEFNPNRPRGRTRFSVAHEIAHTLFPDCTEYIRNRGQVGEPQRDDWQLELLCNIAAAEFIMPVGGELDSNVPVTIDNILKLQKQYDVSTEAISIRLVKITAEPCTIFAAARIMDAEKSSAYRLDYNICSRSSDIELPRGQEIHDSILSQCTAVGYTAKGIQTNIGKFTELYLECVGIPPYPGRKYPRVIGVARGKNGKRPKLLGITSIRGDALEPRGSGRKIIAQIVNDQTPNWGAGFGRAVRNKYPLAQKDFKEWSSSHPNNFKLGNIRESIISDELSIVHMVAQHGYGVSAKPRIRYAALKDALYQLKVIALQQAASVHMPRIGTGYAGGNWGYILELVDEILVKNRVDVTVYTVPGYEPVQAQGRLQLDIAN